MINLREGEDRNLSSVDMQLWEIVYTIALEWNTFVIFKRQQYSISDRPDEFIDFFVPADCTHCHEICEFIEGRMKGWRRDHRDEDDHSWSATNAAVHCTTYSFNGSRPVLPSEVSKVMSHESADGTLIDLGASKRRERAVLQARQRLREDHGFADKLLESMLTAKIEKLLETRGPDNDGR